MHAHFLLCSTCACKLQLAAAELSSIKAVASSFEKELKKVERRSSLKDESFVSEWLSKQGFKPAVVNTFFGNVIISSELAEFKFDWNICTRLMAMHFCF